MYSITRSDGQRTNYDNYNAFADAKQELRGAGLLQNWVSYYDKHGDTHICIYTARGNTVECCGVRQEARRVLHLADDYQACAQAAAIARSENYSEFMGWTI